MMKNKIASIFAAAAISFGIGIAAPAAITSATGYSFVSEAQAFGFNSIKNAAKKAGHKVKKGGKSLGRKTRSTWKGIKIIPGALGEAYTAMGKGAAKRIVRAGKVARKVGKDYGRMGRCIVSQPCKSTIGPRQRGTR